MLADLVPGVVLLPEKPLFPDWSALVASIPFDRVGLIVARPAS
jgi:hypothetical protein